MVAAAKYSPVPELRIVPAPRAVVYCRVSTAAQEADGTSLGTQEAACRAYCAERGYEVVGAYADTYTGAEYRQRPGLSVVRERVRAGAVDRVVSFAIDRLSRNQAHLAILDEEATDHGARLEFVTEDFEDSAVGRFIRNAKAFAAETEREKIGERTQRGKRAKIESGRPLGTGKAPYGLRWADAAKTRYVEDPATVGHLRRIFDDFDQGKSLRGIARALEADGVLPSYHGRSGATIWAISSIRQLLRDRAYTGIGAANRYRTTKAANGKRVATPRPDAEHVALPDGVWPVVIDPALFERVQRRLDLNKRESARRDRNPEVAVLRRGFAVCGYCGHPMVVAQSYGVPVYRCHTDARKYHGCPGGGVVAADELDRDVWTWITATMSDEERIARHIARLQQDDPTEEDLGRVDRQAQAVGRQLANVGTAVAMLGDNPEAMAPLVAQLDALGKQRQALERDRADLLRRQAAWRQTQIRLDDIRLYCRRVAANLGPATFAEQRKRLAQLRVRVEVFRADHSPRWVATSEIVPDAATDSNLFNAA